jgi:PhnB protein
MTPDGYTTVSPYLIVTDAPAQQRFLRDVLGAELVRSMPREDGSVMHSELRIGDSLVMLADAMEGWPASPAHLHVYVDDVDAVYANAIAAGAIEVMPPVQKGDPDKRGGFLLDGVTWWVATRVE